MNGCTGTSLQNSKVDREKLLLKLVDEIQSMTEEEFDEFVRLASPILNGGEGEER